MPGSGVRDINVTKATTIYSAQTTARRCSIDAKVGQTGSSVRSLTFFLVEVKIESWMGRVHCRSLKFANARATHRALLKFNVTMGYLSEIKGNFWMVLCFLIEMCHVFSWNSYGVDRKFDADLPDSLTVLARKIALRCRPFRSSRV